MDNLGGSLFIMAKLTNEQKIEIYNKRKMGYTLNMLSTEYNINVHGIEYLVRLIDKNGFDVLRKDRNRYYSPEFKEKALRRVQAGNRWTPGEYMGNIFFLCEYQWWHDSSGNKRT